ncbi:E3 ubiquitin-protein ligase RNF31-like isoform X2 [Xyrichtys novacula]|uniref:E3 ubiquitin-protein ligase RNF31-like isoform X2 n=1 Tax=Xyrichtys novacula TaxID=13765 RepID=A0AAV1FIW9_XYRNO|nr:E3 ubiquitin-protein ligase RNF31-like isoform X2 [Xyrichtys novacula]
MTLRAEVDMLLQGTHPHPEHFKDITPSIIQKDTLVADAVPILSEEDLPKRDVPQVLTPSLTQSTGGQRPQTPPTGSLTVGECNLCGGPSSLVCPSCDKKPFCDACDDFFHRHPARANHKRDKLQKTKQETCSICGISPLYAQCFTCAQGLCLNCDKLFHSHPDRRDHNRNIITAAKTSSPSLSP